MSSLLGTKIRGLVDASGAGGCSVGSSDDWSLVFHLVAYRAKGALKGVPLRCEMPMSEDALKQWMSRIEPYSLIEATVARVNEQGAALLSDIEVLEEVDADLTSISEELQIPVVIETPRFGALTLDRRVNYYQGVAQWCGGPVRLSLTCADVSDTAAVVGVAESLFGSQDDWDKRVRQYAADQLLQLKNDSWLEEGESELSRDEFLSRMTLEEISVDEDGDVSFWHNDGDLFWGHAILVSGNIDAGLQDAGIHG